MNDTLPLVCIGKNKRPEKNDKMRRSAAAELVDKLIKSGLVLPEDRDGSVDDLVKATRWTVGDGYEIARELEKSCHWDCNMQVAEELDEFGSILDRIFDAAEDFWDKENPRHPLFSVGDQVIWMGYPAVVLGVYESRPQRYKVHREGVGGGPSSFYVVPFEDVSGAAIERASV